MRLHDHLFTRAGLHPDQELTILGDDRVTYGEGAAHASRLAGAMAARGLPSGARVA